MQKNILIQNDRYENLDSFSYISFDIFKELSDVIYSVHLIFQMLQVANLTLKAPIMTAADNKFCDIFPNFRQK